MNKYKTLNKAFDKHLEEVDTYAFGSSQYHLIGATYNWALEMLKVLGQSEFEKLIGITHNGAYTLEEFKNELYIITEEDVNETKKDNPEWYKETYEPEFQAKGIDHKNKKMTIESYYEFLKNIGGDLWSATINPLKGYELKPESIAKHINGDLYDEISGDDFQNGIDLAYTTFLYEEPSISFYGFST